MEVSIPDHRCEDAEELQDLLVDSFLTTNLFPILIFTCSWSFSDLLNTRLVPILVIFTVYTKHHLHCFSALLEVHFKVSRPRLLPFLRSPALCIQKFSLNCCGWNEAFEISKQNGAFAHCQLPSLKNWSSGGSAFFQFHTSAGVWHAHIVTAQQKCHPCQQAKQNLGYIHQRPVFSWTTYLFRCNFSCRVVLTDWFISAQKYPIQDLNWDSPATKLGSLYSRFVYWKRNGLS